MSEDLDGLTHHVKLDDNLRDKQFSKVHCHITILGNYKGNKLCQYWWNVTPDKMYIKSRGQREIIFHLHIMGIVSGATDVWAADRCGYAASDGVKFNDPSNRITCAPGNDDRTYIATIPGSLDGQHTGIKYTVNFQVGGTDYSCDPELEIGMDDE